MDVLMCRIKTGGNEKNEIMLKNKKQKAKTDEKSKTGKHGNKKEIKGETN